MSLRFYLMYVTFTHSTQILGIELDLVLFIYLKIIFFNSAATTLFSYTTLQIGHNPRSGKRRTDY